MNLSLTPLWYKKYIRPTARKQTEYFNSGRVYFRSKLGWEDCEHTNKEVKRFHTRCIDCNTYLRVTAKVIFLALSILLTREVYAVDMDAIAIIESSNNAWAVNQRSKAAGVYQVTPIALADYNQYHIVKYKYSELFNPTVNHRIADWYLHKRIPQLLRSRGLDVNTRNTLIAYNAGIARVGKKLPTETKNYLLKYKAISNDQSL